MAVKRMGRPTGNPKDIATKIRLDQDSFEKMEKRSEEMKIPRAEVVRRGVHKMHDDLKK